MYNGIGLRTVRGSGTNGYVQTNKAFVKAINVRTATELNRGGLNKEEAWKAQTSAEGNAEICEHNAKRAIEAEVFELRDELEDQGLDEDDIDVRCEALRAKLSKQLAQKASRRVGTDSHAAAEAKARDDARLRDAFGAAWNPHLQPEFNVSVFECFDASSSAGLRELDESDRSVQKSAESTLI